MKLSNLMVLCWDLGVQIDLMVHVFLYKKHRIEAQPK